MTANIRATEDNRNLADPKKLIELEEELLALKKQYGIEDKTSWWVKTGDFLAEKTGKPVKVQRKKYIRLALICGWFSGSHRFYSGQKLLGILYLLFCWTGIPFAMTMIDLMIILPKTADEEGMVEL